MTALDAAAVIELGQPEAADGALCGHKAATLALLGSKGVAVLDGVVLPVNLLSTWTAGTAAPDDVRNAVAETVARLGDGPHAVRSSGVAEDLAGASYAGAYRTVLGAHGRDEILAAVRACVDSRDTAIVSAYRGGTPPPLAVLIQPMLNPRTAGIAFTADPVTGDTGRVRVSAVAGVADRLAAGEVTPDEWEVVDRRATRLAGAGHRVLDAAGAETVAAAAVKVADTLGSPQDVEWAEVGGEIVILQSRPITALPVPPAVTLDGGGWEKDLAHFPEQVTPFGGSIYVAHLETAVAQWAEECGLLIGTLETRVVGGEIYVRPRPVIGPAESRGPNPPAWLLGLLARALPPLRTRMAAAKRYLESGSLERLPAEWESVWRDEFVQEIDAIMAVELTELDDAELLGHLDRCEGLLARGFQVHFRLFTPYMVALHELASVCSVLLGWDLNATLELLAGHSPASVAGARELADLRSAIRADPDTGAALRLKASDPVAALDTTRPDLRGELADWIRAHGWRTANYDAGSPTLAERPGLITRMLLADASPGAVDAAEAEERARSGLTAEQLPRFEAALKAARRCYPLREDNVVLTDNVPCGLLRRWLLEAGSRLVDRGALARTHDAAYLEIQELRAALSHNSIDVALSAARRRGEWAWTRAHPGPLHVGNVGTPPSVSRLPEPARRINGALMWMFALEYPAPEDVSGQGLSGAAASPGTYRGTARIIRGEADFPTLQPGEVLVAPVTTPAWTPLFTLAGAVVTDGGGVLSHAAIVAREHGLPAVLGTRKATSQLRDGDVVTVDGTVGRVVKG